MTHGVEDRARGVDVRGGRNSMNCYRLAAHFASRSCDGLVKRFGLSSSNPFRHSPPPHPHPPLPPPPAAAPTPTRRRRFLIPSRCTFFFHRTPPRRPAGVVKRVTGVVGHSGFSKQKTSHEDACQFKFYGERENEDGENGLERKTKFYEIFLLRFFY